MRLSRIVEDCIKTVKFEFEQNPYNFLSEGDVQCRLFLELYQRKELSRLEETRDGRKIIPLHSEVTYFDESGKKLSKHIDISAFNPQSAEVYSQNRRCTGLMLSRKRRVKPSRRLSKGYQFGDSYFLIEIKLNRGNWSKNETEKKWRRDLEKLAKLRRRLVNEVWKTTEEQECIFVSILFDKRAHFSRDEIKSLEEEYPGIKLVYATPIKSE